MSEIDIDIDEYHEPEVSSVVFSRTLLKKFILLYKDLPCLWNRGCAGYKQKFKRFEAIAKLTAMVQEHDPTATRVHVLRKIESLRACVRREHKKVRESRKFANSPEDVYKPNLWYYSLFSFVFADGGDSAFNVCKEEVLVDTDEDSPDDNSHFEAVDTTPGNYHAEYSLASSMVELTNDNKRFTEYEDDPKSKRHCTEVDDEYDAIGVNVAAKLRNLPPNMRILAEKLVNDVLFQAQMNGLSSSTTITTPDPFKSDPN